MDALSHLTRRIDDLGTRVAAIDAETDFEATALWDAVMEIRRAVNRLEELHGSSSLTQWTIQTGGPRHPDSGPELGA
jgi:hypothetical protein